MRSNDNSGPKAKPYAPALSMASSALSARKVKEILWDVDKAAVNGVVYILPGRDDVCNADMVKSWGGIVPLNCQVTTPAGYLAHRLVNAMRSSLDGAGMPGLVLRYANFPDGTTQMTEAHKDLLIERFGHEREGSAIAEHMRHIFVAGDAGTIETILSQRKAILGVAEPSTAPDVHSYQKMLLQRFKLAELGVQKIAPTSTKLKMKTEITLWDEGALEKNIGEAVGLVKACAEALGWDEAVLSQKVPRAHKNRHRMISSGELLGLTPEAIKTHIARVQKGEDIISPLLGRLHKLFQQALVYLPADAPAAKTLEAALPKMDEAYNQLRHHAGLAMGWVGREGDRDRSSTIPLGSSRD